MSENDLKACLEGIYQDYFDGLYNDHQLKIMLKQLYLDSNIPINKWSEMLLDAQWKHASEEDYEIKRKELEEVD